MTNLPPPPPDDLQSRSLYEMLRAAAERFPRHTALDYLGATMTYQKLLEEIDRCAGALAEKGLSPGDTVTLSLPNIPGALVLFYALNRLGARVAMTHPLSAPGELKHCLNLTGSRWAVTVDMFYGRFRDILAETGVEKLLVTGIADYLPAPKRLAFKLGRGRKIPPIPREDRRVLYYRDVMKGARRMGAKADAGVAEGRRQDAVVLFSGGTTALPKGVLLSAYNFNALAVSMWAVTECRPGDRILTILPVFHGFGLGICVHAALTAGLYVILVPEFSADRYIRCLRRHRPAYIAGVPTLFQALLQHKDFGKVSFRGLRGAYSGGDSLPFELKERFDRRIRAQGSPVELMEGYGLTECVTACVVSPRGRYRMNAAGLPIPGLRVKVVSPGGAEELPPGETGEICVAGPTVMAGYLNNEEETAAALRKHADGETWLHTGDAGCLDAEGYLFFKTRLKRILKVSGVGVYPVQVEQVLESHPLVRRSCVIGVSDPYQMTRVKAFVVLNDPAMPEAEAREALLAHCRRSLIKWAVPREIEFRPSLPTTLVGKVDYRALEAEKF